MAYQKASLYINELLHIVGKGKIDDIIVLGLKNLNKEYRDEEILSVKNLLNTISKINVELRCFPINFGHLFKYDFKSKDYLLLVNSSENFFNSLVNQSLGSSKNNNNTFSIDEFAEMLSLFISELKIEINEQ